MPKKKKGRIKKFGRPSSDEEVDFEEEEINEGNREEHELHCKILSVHHPLESTEIGKNLSLTIIQKCLTYVMTIHGGKANEQDLLDFLGSNWKWINMQVVKPFIDLPSRRLLHIHFSLTKCGMPLFVKSETDDQCWRLNELSADKMELIANQKSLSFEDAVVSVLIQIDPAPLPVIIEAMKGNEALDGIFQSLPFERRVRACLIAKKSDGIVGYDKRKDVWGLISKMPPAETETIPFYRQLWSLL